MCAVQSSLCGTKWHWGRFPSELSPFSAVIIIPRLFHVHLCWPVVRGVDSGSVSARAVMTGFVSPTVQLSSLGIYIPELFIAASSSEIKLLLQTCKILLDGSEEIAGGWRKFQNEELHNFYLSPDMVSVIKSNHAVRWTRHVGRMLI